MKSKAFMHVKQDLTQSYNTLFRQYVLEQCHMPNKPYS